MGQRYRETEDQKQWPVFQVTRILLKKEGLNQKLKRLNRETRQAN